MRTHSAPGRDDAAVGRFIEQFALDLAATGWPRTPARVFAAILTSPDGGHTAAELAARLHLSPAAISGAVRYLMQIGLIARERDPGARRDRYRLYDDMWYETFTRAEPILIRIERRLREGIEAVGAGTPVGDHLEEVRRFYEFVRGERPRLLAKWRTLRVSDGRAQQAAQGNRERRIR